MAQDFVDIDKIEDSWILDINANLKATLGLKTIATYEADYDTKTLQQMLLLSPFVLVQYFDGRSDERYADRSTSRLTNVFHVYVGSQDLRDRRTAQKGCYTILKEFRKRYDGGVITIATPAASVVLVWENERFVMSEGGLIVYQAVYSIIQ